MKVLQSQYGGVDELSEIKGKMIESVSFESPVRVSELTNDNSVLQHQAYRTKSSSPPR